jgi:hypothetical protein
MVLIATMRSRTENWERRTLFRVAKAYDLGIFPVLRKHRAVAQLGSALEWGSRGRGFESRRPDIAKRRMGAPRIGDNFQSGIAAKRPAVAKAMAGKLQRAQKGHRKVKGPKQIPR